MPTLHAIKGFLKEKVAGPVLNLLKQGITPKRLALSMASGAVIGMFPIIGSTTLICTVIALVLRLNLPAIQLANYLVYPLQIILVIPFISFGAVLFQVEMPPLSVQELILLFDQDFWGTIVAFFDAILCAVAAWVLFCIPVFPALYLVLVQIFSKIKLARADTD
jgi:uncharacterized protein (DUF2062 family)